MTELISTAKLVKMILETDPKARNSDSYLYLQVIRHEAVMLEIDIRSVAVETFLAAADRWGFTGFETVRRSRQKVQQEYPHLAGDKAVRRNRAKREQVFREFARSEA